jgi:hypothetical protein
VPSFLLPIRMGVSAVLKAIPSHVEVSDRKGANGIYGENNLRMNVLKGVLWEVFTEKDWLEIVAFLLGRQCMQVIPPADSISVITGVVAGVVAERLRVVAVQRWQGTFTPSSLGDCKQNASCID